MKTREEQLAELKRKKQPSTFKTIDLINLLYRTHTSLQDDLFRFRKLERYLTVSPYQIYTDTLTTQFARAYSFWGLFGRGPAVAKEVTELAEQQKPYLVDHLNVMNEIRNRGPK